MHRPPRHGVIWKPRDARERDRLDPLWYMSVLIVLAVGVFLLTLWMLK